MTAVVADIAAPVACRERNIPEIESMYEVSFPKLSERYFKQGPWPHVEAISDLVDQDHVFCLLYKVMSCNPVRVLLPTQRMEWLCTLAIADNSSSSASASLWPSV